MKSKARIKSHPLHPILVSFPIALFTGALLSDIAGIALEFSVLHQTALHLALGGIGFALLAAVPGIIDFLYVIPPGSSGKKRGARHGLLNITVVIVFAVTVWLRTEADIARWGIVGLEAFGVVLLSIAGWMGGTLVYRNQIGVDIRYAHAGKWNEQYFDDARGELEVATTDELKVNQMKLLRVGEKRIVLARTETGYGAFNDHCTHRGGSLAGGSLICGTVQCPWHGSQFDTKTGKVKAGPAASGIEVYQTTERNGKVYVDLG